MKRSEINAKIEAAKKFFDDHGFKLPKWAFWSPDDWKQVGHEADEIRQCMLGWDLTDFGSGQFERTGLLLFTIRNGNADDPDNVKTYAEKIMLVQTDQLTPMHFHWAKMEDIINRGGGRLALRLYNATDDEQLDESAPVRVSIDGIEKTFQPGEKVLLDPGESIALPRRLYHEFWAEGGTAMIGEVSMVNDDNVDNRFLEPVGRFPEIDEDAQPVHLLCNEYPKAG